MDYNLVSISVLKLWDALQNDPESESLLDKLDSAENDQQVKDGIRSGVERLKAVGKTDLANEIVRMTTGFAF